MVVEHYAIVDESHDDVEEGELSEPCKCSCKTEGLVKAVEVFILTCVGILVLSLTIYSCLALRFVILKRRKSNKERVQHEADPQKEEKEKI